MQINTITKVEADGISITINPELNHAILTLRDEGCDPEWKGSLISKELAAALIAGLKAAAGETKEGGFSVFGVGKKSE